MTRIRALSAAGGLLLLAVLAGCGPSPSASTPAAGGAPPPPTPVTAIRVQPREVPVLLEAVGRTEGSREVEVRARVSGILEKQLYAEGRPVKAGQPMFSIERAPFEIALAQARAALAQERSRHEQAQREVERLKRLVAQRAISQREYDDATTSLKSTAASIQAAQAKVREAELNLSYTTIEAPISGIAGRALRSEGSLVLAGGESSLVTTITRTDPIWVRFALSEPEFEQLRDGRGTDAEVRLEFSDGRRYERTGRLNYTASVVDTRLGTVQMRAEFENADLALLPGQFVRVQVVAGQRDAIVVPQTAVLQADQGRIVWTVDGEGKAVPRPVQVGRWVGSDWVILAGLNPGDTVIVDNLLRLRPGVRVAVQPPAAAASAAAVAK